MAISFKNYDMEKEFSEEKLREYKRKFPVDPEKGEWAKVETKDTYWLTLPENCQGELENIKRFVEGNKGNYTDIVTIGMGGSSRPTDVVSMFKEATDATGANVHVLETLDEDSIDSLLKSLNLNKTLFIIISKSGETAETMALAKLAAAKGGDFIAITTKDKDSSLMKFLTKEQGVEKKEIQPHADRVGGRYTFFSNIGMLPAALTGVNVDDLLDSARRAMESDIKYQLGQFMADMESQDRPYMRVIIPEKLAKLGPWIEQLVAESLGKHDVTSKERGIIAISERDFDPSVYKRGDVFAIRVKLGKNDGRNEFTQQVVKQGTPLFKFNISSPEEVAGVMYNLEFATGMSGILMGIDPFSQPGVEAKKELTRGMKGKMEKAIKREINSDMEDEEIFEVTKQIFNEIISKHRTEYRVEIADGITLDYGDFVTVLEDKYGVDFKKEIETKGDLGINIDESSASDIYKAILLISRNMGKSYSAILPYDETYKEHSVWAKARGLMRKLGLVDIFGVGPVYEHSYSQFFHEGPNKGIFTFITSIDPGSIKIPGDNVPGITFAMQNTLQALGAMEAEVTNEIPRLAIRIEIEGEFNKEKMEVLERFFDRVRNNSSQ